MAQCSYVKPETIYGMDLVKMGGGGGGSNTIFITTTATHLLSY